MSIAHETRDWTELFSRRAQGEADGAIAEILGLLAVPNLISVAGGFPDPRTFPREQIASLLREFEESGEASAFQYAPTGGLPSTIDAVCGWLEATQHRAPAEDEIVMTSGAIEVLELVSRSFLDRGDVMVVEAPTYLGAIIAFRGYGADIVGVPMDADGLDVDALERMLQRGLLPKLLYTIPDHQNPAGVSLAAERRQPLIDLARHYGFAIVEDVAYRELGFEGDAPSSLWSLAPDVVLQAGTTSKTFFPGVRLGWATAPADVVARLVTAKQTTDQCSGALGQRLLEEYIRRGWIDEQLTQSRALYRQKAERLLAAFARAMPEQVRWTTPRGGFYSWLTVPGDATLLARRAVEERVGIVPGALFFPDKHGFNNVRISFSLVDDSDIDEGVDRLAALL
jgi:2-aminoadipate transaminase